MAGQAVDLRVAAIALEQVDTHSFELFAQSFWSALQGSAFVPVGGYKDGGADGFEQGLFEDGTVTKYLQASVQEDPTKKITATVNRLREFGRVPKTLYYLTNMAVQNSDVLEDTMSESLNVRVVVRDIKYIVSQVNNSIQTIYAYKSYVEQFAAFLSQVGSARTVARSAHLPVRSLCVFLGQELERRSGRTQLLETVTDSLIIWALEGTDPDKGIFLTPAEILEKILAAVPAAGQFIKGELGTRLTALASKNSSTGREVRWYRKENKYCLPHEMRDLVESENIEDESLKTDVSDQFRIRLAHRIVKGEGPVFVETCVKVIHRTLELAFERQGLELTYFVTQDDGDDENTIVLSDHLRAAIVEMQLSGAQSVSIAERCLPVLREVLYEASDREREYLGKMSRTYAILFMLQNEPKIVEYFRSMRLRIHFVYRCRPDR